jgi:hypothetical protein
MEKIKLTKWQIILIGILGLLIIFAVGKNMIIANVLKGGVKALTGLKMHIASTDVGIFTTKVDIEGFELYNPAGFEDKLMIDMPELYVDYSLSEMLKKKVHLFELRIHLKEFVVVRNKDGKLNLDSLKVVKDTKKETAAAETPTPEKKKAKPESSFQIDVMSLKIDKVIFKDYTAGAKPKITEYPVKINEKFTNINDPKQVANVIIVKAVMNTAIARLTNFDVNALASSASDTLKSATKIVGSTAGAAVDTGKKAAKTATDTTKQIGDKAVGAAGGAVDAGKETINKILPFGGKEEAEK